MEENKDLEVLKTLNDKLGNPDSKEVDEAKIENPVTAIEDSLGSFVKNSFACVAKNRVLERTIDEAITARLPEANFGQLIDLKDKLQRNSDNATSNLINPFIPVMAAKQEKELEATSLTHTGEALHKKASKDVLQGLTALNQLLSVATSITENSSPVEVVETTPPKKEEDFKVPSVE